MADREPEVRVAIPAGFCGWHSMAFVHWRVEPSRVQALLPPGLQADVLDGAAWVSLTPFEMTDIRPALPGLRRVGVGLTTRETNVRTYVRGPAGDGLWFLSLDVVNTLIPPAARAVVGAPYFRADLSIDDEDAVVRYRGLRTGSDAGYAMRLRPGVLVEHDELTEWLTGRWRAYTRHLGRLVVLTVEHEPWPVRAAELVDLREDVVSAGGLPGLGAPDLVQYSDGVDVRVGFPRWVA